MASYDFSTLGSPDLEKLVCDLLNADLPASSQSRYRTFKDGKDKGIDLLYSITGSELERVGQVKHYYRTGYNGLIAHLRNPEKDKVVNLNPKRYILATSVDLTVHQVQEIKRLFKPYIKSISDIYAKSDLNDLLEKHPLVLDNHFKLWFSDTTVLTKLLSADMYYRSADFVENELTKRIRLFVDTPVLDLASRCLEENHYVIITGEPGVGKSTLAEMLVYEKLKDDYSFLYIHDNIKEAETFLKNDDSKQLIYFDDFLGSNAAEINKAQGSETTLTSIIRRIRRSSNKRLVFTTRVHILNIVVDQSEKLERIKIRSGETLFNLEIYDEDVKTQILINHTDESELPEDLKNVLRQTETINFIIKHKGFNPRSIEFITSRENVVNLTPDKYLKFIISNFNNPTDIWRNAYRQQIGDPERWLLNTLLTFEGAVDLIFLENAFNSRLNNEPSQEINAYKTALVRLDKGFIEIKNQKVDFINPSLKDFLINFISTDPHEIKRMVDALSYICQLSSTFTRLLKSKNISIPQEIREDMMLNYIDYTRSSYEDHDLIHLATFIEKEVNHEDKDDYLVDIIDRISDWEALYKDFQLNKAFSEFLNTTRLNYRVQDALTSRIKEIVEDLILGENDLSDAITQLEKLTDLFQLNFFDFDTHNLELHFNEIATDAIDNEIDWLEQWATDMYEVHEKIDEFKDFNERFAMIGFDYEIDMREFKSRDWDEIMRENDFRRLMEKDRD